MKILVKYNNDFYFWVDTVTLHDVHICAILVSSAGNALHADIDKITVLDNTYDFEKEKQKCIERLKNEQAQLRLQMELDAGIAQVYKPITEVK